MSILIKGLNMPKDCVSCRWHHRTGVCVLTGVVTNTGRYCPLVEVPTPHGRLIDGDNVIDLLREQLTGDRDTVYEYYDDGLEMAISELSIVPTIIEAEEE